MGGHSSVILYHRLQLVFILLLSFLVSHSFPRVVSPHWLQALLHQPFPRSVSLDNTPTELLHTEVKPLKSLLKKPLLPSKKPTRIPGGSRHENPPPSRLPTDSKKCAGKETTSKAEKRKALDKDCITSKSTSTTLGGLPTYSNPLSIFTTSGIYEGFIGNKSLHLVDTWLGIRYAKPPTGHLRFRAPVLLDNPMNNVGQAQSASKFGDACPQKPFDDKPGISISEDCLFLNIYRPSSLDSESLMPVLVWIHGGSLTYGTAADVDGSVIVSSSVDLQKPIMFVSLNYRLNSFGFLNTDDLPLEDLQVGLQDQIACLKWLNLNIRAFGGDPDRITIWGQSAGAFTVSLLSTYLYNSPLSSLFRAAIMNSGSPTCHTIPAVNVYDRPGMPYSLLLETTGCNSQTSGYTKPFYHPYQADSLECLRRLDYDVLLNATLTIGRTLPFSRQVSVWGPSYKFGSIIDKRPSKRLEENEFLKIPMIMGTNKDEGTLSALGPSQGFNASSANSDTSFQAYMSNSSILDVEAIDPIVYQKVSTLYPNEPSLGSPFNTGSALFGQRKIFKRMAAWFGDLHYQAPKRLWAHRASSTQPVYVYYFDGPRLSNEHPYAGVAHASELPLIFGSIKLDGLPGDERQATNALADKIRNHYISFVHDLSPGDDWPEYKVGEKKVMRFNKQILQGELIADDWRAEQINYLNSQPALDTYMT